MRALRSLAPAATTEDALTVPPDATPPMGDLPPEGFGAAMDRALAAGHGVAAERIAARAASGPSGDAQESSDSAGGKGGLSGSHSRRGKLSGATPGDEQALAALNAAFAPPLEQSPAAAPAPPAGNSSPAAGAEGNRFITARAEGAPISAAVALPRRPPAFTTTHAATAGSPSAKSSDAGVKGATSADANLSGCIILEPADEADTKEENPRIEELPVARLGPAEAGSAGTPATRGIATAPQHALMQRAAATQQSAGTSEQELPGNPAPSFPDAAAVRLKPGQRLEKAEAASATPVAASGRPAAPMPEDFTDATVAAARGEGGARWVERTHDLVSLHALRLRDSSADSLRVVIRPGPGLQLSLDLHLGANGGVEVRAAMNRGDYGFLNSHWPELQQQLEPRGVRLAALVPGRQSGDDAEGFEHSRQRHKKNEQEPAEVFAGLPFVGAAASPVKPRRPATRRGWELWA